MWKSKGIFLNQGKQAKSGKSQGNHDCAILSASITNSNFTSKSTLNAYICIEVFKIVARGHTPDPIYWGMDTSPDPTPLTASQLDLGATRLSSSLSYLVRPFPTLLEKSGKSQGISFGLESGHPVYMPQSSPSSEIIPIR